MRWPHENGRIFRLFVLAYCGYRFAVEFIKPTGPKYAGVSAIQVACLYGVVVCTWMLYGRRPAPDVPTTMVIVP